MNNTNICVEGCNLPSTPNDIKILLKQLIRDVKELSETTEAKLLCHDGKIAEMCRYIKDNLDNSLRCMVDAMKETGELDSIIASVIATISKDNEYINVLSLGAKEGSDITAIINAGLEEFHNVYIPEGTYIVSDSIVMNSFDKLKGAGKNTIIEFTGDSFIKKLSTEFTNHLQVQDLNVYNKGTKEAIAIDIKSNNSATATADCDFRNLWFTDFYTGVFSGYAWCNSFYNVRFNTCKQPLRMEAQSNNNNFYSCHFLSTPEAEKCLFVNNDLTSFFGCEFANYIKGTSMNSKLLFSGCYFENIGDLKDGVYSDLFLEVGTTNNKEQINVIDFVGCHHTGNTLENDRYLKLQLHSKVNGSITSDVMKIFIDGVNTLNIKRPMKKGTDIKYMSAHSKYNQYSTSAPNYTYHNGKILIQNKTGAYFRMQPINIKKGDKIHVDLSMKSPIESYLHFHSASQTSPTTGTRQTFTMPKCDEITKFSIDFEATADYSFCTLHQFSLNNALLDYIVISKMNDTEETIKMINADPYYMESKPTITPDKVMSVYSTNSNETWTFNGESWN